MTSRYPLWDPKRPSLAPVAPLGRTAAELGIPMPSPSILPMVCAFGIVVMFGGLFLLATHGVLAVCVMALGGLTWISALFGWLTTPLEETH